MAEETKVFVPNSKLLAGESLGSAPCKLCGAENHIDSHNPQQIVESMCEHVGVITTEHGFDGIQLTFTWKF